MNESEYIRLHSDCQACGDISDSSIQRVIRHYEESAIVEMRSAIGSYRMCRKCYSAMEITSNTWTNSVVFGFQVGDLIYLPRGKGEEESSSSSEG